MTDGDRDCDTGVEAGREGDLLGGEADAILLSVECLDDIFSRLTDSDEELFLRKEVRTGKTFSPIPLELVLIRLLLVSGDGLSSASAEDEDEQLEDREEPEFLTLGTIERLD